MTKQEEIRIGAEIIVSDCTYGMAKSPMSSRDTVKELFKYLHSQGVVIKVDRELPKVPQAEIAPMYDKVFREGISAGLFNIVEAGYVAVEPLV